ncbi:hypothetical protein [Spirilliplanes yamanashiensis]|uniref:Secreted protein n=1 Tax=Spirilliplanes yamanashiensis TaxID=42233 RepID=A0A8J3YDD5_9ACTN|nr:hypothetical protein [Spirilliplanes yamanashiensis]MDP9816317.1 hypothetical protein [Spirilliplanes yamanashiensis]GIJ05844.1 hypothetical protein Sya03_51960 [Spirilliplanes yamanashiensis]
MTSTQIVVLIVVILAVLLIAAVAARVARRRSLQKTFGPEYDRVVAEKEDRGAAEQELRERQSRHAELELKPLSAESRARYSAAWEEVQVRFVDEPADAVRTADALVTRLIAERGYPTGSYDDQLATLSVEHARTLGHYRDAHEISERNDRGEATTEDLRQALVHYRALVADLLGEEPVQSTDLPRQQSTDDGARPDPARPDIAGSAGR